MEGSYVTSQVPQVPVKVLDLLQQQRVGDDADSSTDDGGGGVAVRGDGIRSLYAYDVSIRDKVMIIP